MKQTVVYACWSKAYLSRGVHRVGSEGYWHPPPPWAADFQKNGGFPTRNPIFFYILPLDPPGQRIDKANSMSARKNTNVVHLSAIWENTAHVQWMRCSPHLIHWTSAVFPHIALKWTPFSYRNVNLGQADDDEWSIWQALLGPTVGLV